MEITRVFKHGNTQDYGYLINQKFGCWKVLGEDRTLVQQKGRYKRFKLKCQCDCGYVGLVDYHNLKNGQTTKCFNCRILPDLSASFNATLAQYKNAARKRNLDWGLSSEQFKAICLQDCTYCGSKPSNCKTVKQCYGEFIYSGVDRIDSSKGYTIENCTSCCKNCNFMKRALSVNEFLNHIKKIQDFQNRL